MDLQKQMIATTFLFCLCSWLLVSLQVTYCIESGDLGLVPASLQSKGLKVGIVTWNLAERSPKLSECKFLEDFEDCDIVALGIQECEDIRPRRKEGRRSRKWRQIHKSKFAKKHELLCSQRLGGIQTVVYASKSASKLIRDIQCIDVPCGVGNVLSNKGAIAVLLRLRNRKTVALINAHLAAQQSKVEARNADYCRIASMVALKAHKRWLRPLPKRCLAREPPEWWHHLFDGVFFFGDLNYRLELPRLEIELSCADASDISNGRLIMEPSAAADLLAWDQLSRERQAGGLWSAFTEAMIAFPPTFKYDLGSTVLDSSAKQRVPAYTDRILYCSPPATSPPPAVHIQPLEYCASDIRCSDHRPVHAKFLCTFANDDNHHPASPL